MTVFKLKKERFLYDVTKFIEDEEIEPDLQLLHKMKDYNLAKLIAIYSDTEDEKEKEIAKLLFIRDLGLVDLDRQSCILTDLIGELDRIMKKLDEHIETFKSHRHKKDPSYSEKPTW